METFCAILLAGSIAPAFFDRSDPRIPVISYRKRGGLHFLRIGTLQLSWCRTKTA